MISIGNTSKVISSPEYPADFPLGIRCKWIITTPSSHDIHVHFIDVDMEDSADCSGDRLQIIDEMVISYIILITVILLLAYVIFMYYF